MAKKDEPSATDERRARAAEEDAPRARHNAQEKAPNERPAPGAGPGEEGVSAAPEAGNDPGLALRDLLGMDGASWFGVAAVLVNILKGGDGDFGPIKVSTPVGRKQITVHVTSG